MVAHTKIKGLKGYFPINFMSKIICCQMHYETTKQGFRVKYQILNGLKDAYISIYNRKFIR